MTLLAYSALWKVARPFLRRHKRMREGFEQRLAPDGWPESLLDGAGLPELLPDGVAGAELSAGNTGVADSPAGGTVGARPGRGGYSLWLHGASGGEAYLTRELVAELAASGARLGVVCTSCTRQGVEVLQKVRADYGGGNLRVCVNYFPLDEPAIMRKAVRQIFGPRSDAPKAAVLLETEIWPGFLQACKEHGVSVLIINGRMTEGSFKAYRHIRGTLRRFAPERILATAQTDLERFSAIFDMQGQPAINAPAPQDGVKAPEHAVEPRCALMPNIKFDRVRFEQAIAPNPLEALFGGQRPPILALASVREEEEKELAPLVAELLANAPQSCVVVAPRHMHRLEAWRGYLRNLNFAERSSLRQFKPGQAVLWDTFGELTQLYGISSAVFVGGSLAPLGGQNFLEPLGYGLIPCTGPSWSNFYWVGEEIFTIGLVKQVRDASEIAAFMLQQLQKATPREQVQTKLEAYLKPRQGGTRLAVRYINKVLSGYAPSDQTV